MKNPWEKHCRGNIFGENDDFLEWENVGIGLPKRVDFPKDFSRKKRKLVDSDDRWTVPWFFSRGFLVDQQYLEETPFCSFYLGCHSHQPNITSHPGW